MDENQTSAPPSTPNPAKWIGQLVAAVILAEGIWGLLASLTSNLLVPLLARVMDGDSRSPLYLGKGELNIPALFNSFLALCLAGIVFVLLHEWSRRKPAPVRAKMMRGAKKTQPAAGPPSIMAPPEPVAARTQTAVTPPPAPQISQAPLSSPPVLAPQPSKPTPPPVVAPAKPAKPKPPREVYYNIVGEPINPTEDD